MANSAQPVCVLALQRRNKSELGPLRTATGSPSSLCGGWGPWAAATEMFVFRVMGGYRVGGRWGGAYALL